MQGKRVVRLHDVLVWLVQPFSFKNLLRFLMDAVRFSLCVLGGRVCQGDHFRVSRVITLVLTLGPALAMGWVWYATNRSDVPAVFLHELEANAYINYGWVGVGHDPKLPG